jgi:hypothetical protein
MKHQRLLIAFVAYAVLAALAWFMVEEKRLRAAVLLLFVALAAKTLIAWKAKAYDPVPKPDSIPASQSETSTPKPNQSSPLNH